MPALRRGKGSNNQKKKTLSKVAKCIKLPFGNSYIDCLPDAIVYSIYYYKHQLDFGPTLNIRSKQWIAIDSEIIETRIPIQKY